ncbi:MAG: hypothetical protein JRH20_28230, partial [Deltaproteobacteria bacterium]|nr:hypothetical protein [Deltaproteobacteria bacterium]
MAQSEKDARFLGTLKTWVVSVALLGSVAAVLYFTVYTLDFFIAGDDKSVT